MLEQRKHAIVVHVHYFDSIISDLPKLLSKVPSEFDVYITYNSENESMVCDHIRPLRNDFKINVFFRSFEKKTYDLFPFLAIIGELDSYRSVTKLHFKHGQDLSDTAWGAFQVELFLANLEMLAAAFEKCSSLSIVGADLLFFSKDLLIGSNRKTLNVLETFFFDRPLSKDYGFFAGSVFTVAPISLKALSSWVIENENCFKISSFRDGELEHALERIIPLIASDGATQRKVGMLSQSDCLTTNAIDVTNVFEGFTSIPSRYISQILLLKSKGISFDDLSNINESTSDFKFFNSPYNKSTANSREKTLRATHDTLGKINADISLILYDKSDFTYDVSIIIPVYGNPDLLRQCVDSVLTYSVCVEYEIILVDNRFDSQTSSTIVSIASRLPNISYIKAPKNLNFSGGCNLGAFHSKGKFLVFLNSDTYVSDKWIGSIIETLNASSSSVVQPVLVDNTGRVDCAGVGFSRYSSFGVSLYSGLEFIKLPSGRLMEVQSVTGACLAIRYSDFQKINGFDSVYVNGMEDLDLCLKVKNVLGGKCIVDLTSKVYHLGSQSAGRFDFVYYNRSIFFRRWSNIIVHDFHKYYPPDKFLLLTIEFEGGDKSDWLKINHEIYIPHFDSADSNTNLLSISRLVIPFVTAAQEISPVYTAYLSFIIERYKLMSSDVTRVMVFSGDLSSCFAEVALDIYQDYRAAKTSCFIGGSLCNKPIKSLWKGLDHVSNKVRILDSDERLFNLNALLFVLRNRADVVHFTDFNENNLLVSLLYQAIWQTKTVWCENSFYTQSNYWGILTSHVTNIFKQEDKNISFQSDIHYKNEEIFKLEKSIVINFSDCCDLSIFEKILETYLTSENSKRLFVVRDEFFLSEDFDRIERMGFQMVGLSLFLNEFVIKHHIGDVVIFFDDKSFEIYKKELLLFKESIDDIKFFSIVDNDMAYVDYDFVDSSAFTPFNKLCVYNSLASIRDCEQVVATKLDLQTFKILSSLYKNILVKETNSNYNPHIKGLIESIVNSQEKML